MVRVTMICIALNLTEVRKSRRR